MRRLRHADRASLRGALWALRASRVVRRQLVRGPLDRVVVPPAPVLPARAAHGVAAVLRRRRDSCLVRAVVRQAWHVAQGSPRDVVIGVTAPGAGFAAHAWLEGDDPAEHDGFAEIARRSPAS